MRDTMMFPEWRSKRALALCAWAMIVATGTTPRATAQATAPKVHLSGTVLDAAQLPIDGAIVELLSLGQTRSDSAGAFRFSGVPAGSVILRVAKIGFMPVMKTVLLTADSVDLDVTLHSLVHMLPAVIVLHDSAFTSRSDPTGFFRRRLYSAGGHFMTAEDIARWHFVETSQLMRIIPGVLVNGDGVVSVARGVMTLMGSNCTGTEVLVNGVSSPGLSLNMIPTSSVKGVEVYSGAATTPASLHSSMTACGTVAIWTR